LPLVVVSAAHLAESLATFIVTFNGASKVLKKIPSSPTLFPAKLPDEILPIIQRPIVAHFRHGFSPGVQFVTVEPLSRFGARHVIQFDTDFFSVKQPRWFWNRSHS
jgi:hypothetical protein